MKELYEFVVNWMIENRVIAEESIHQRDNIQEKLTEFVCDCYNLVKEDIPEDL